MRKHRPTSPLGVRGTLSGHFQGRITRCHGRHNKPEHTETQATFNTNTCRDLTIALAHMQSRSAAPRSGTTTTNTHSTSTIWRDMGWTRTTTHAAVYDPLHKPVNIDGYLARVLATLCIVSGTSSDALRKERLRPIGRVSYRAEPSRGCRPSISNV